jgi:hypothetical protein
LRAPRQRRVERGLERPDGLRRAVAAQTDNYDGQALQGVEGRRGGGAAKRAELREGHH